MTDTQKRAKNAMIGLAIGDSLSWTAMYHRSFLLPPWTRRIRREMDASSENHNIILHPMPFSLNQPPESFNISPSSNTEWAAFTSQILLNCRGSEFSITLFKEWQKLSQSQNPVRGSVSIQSAIQNITRGLKPPQTGKENPHYFDDSAMSRAVPIGILFAGYPEKAAAMAEKDASVTNSEDGVWAAQAMAASISMACSGQKIPEIIEFVLSILPGSSWIKRIFVEALEIEKASSSIFNIIPDLQSRIINREYSYGNIAPETLSLLFIIFKQYGEDIEKAVSTACFFPKSSESLPALVGALSASASSEKEWSASWLKASKYLKGICIPALSGVDYLDLIEQLSKLSGEVV